MLSTAARSCTLLVVVCMLNRYNLQSASLFLQQFFEAHLARHLSRHGNAWQTECEHDFTRFLFCCWIAYLSWHGMWHLIPIHSNVSKRANNSYEIQCSVRARRPFRQCYWYRWCKLHTQQAVEILYVWVGGWRHKMHSSYLLFTYVDM